MMFKEKNDLDIKASARRKEYMRRAGSRLLRGWQNISPLFKILLVLLALLIGCLIFALRFCLFDYAPGEFLAGLFDFLSLLLSVVASVMVAELFLWSNGAPQEADLVEQKLLQIGLVDSFGFPPSLIKLSPKDTNPQILIYTFDSPIPLTSWKKAATEIGSALRCTVLDIIDGEGASEIKVFVRKGRYAFPPVLPWPADLIVHDDRKILLGEDKMGDRYVWDLKISPHLICAGRTGSGKSVLMCQIATQVASLHRENGVTCNDAVFVIDFKSSATWYKLARLGAIVVDDLDETLKLLKGISQEATARKKLLRKADADNIDHYREKTGVQLHRQFLLIDEAFDVLCVPKGASSDIKQKYEEIIDLTTRAATQYRSVGIHLVLGLQRPDMSLSGQIRNNCFKICGLSDPNLRDVTFGHSMNDYDDNLPKFPGEFIDENGKVFKAYLPPEI